VEAFISCECVYVSESMLPVLFMAFMTCCVTVTTFLLGFTLLLNFYFISFILLVNVLNLLLIPLAHPFVNEFVFFIFAWFNNDNTQMNAVLKFVMIIRCFLCKHMKYTSSHIYCTFYLTVTLWMLIFVQCIFVIIDYMQIYM